MTIPIHALGTEFLIASTAILVAAFVRIRSLSRELAASTIASRWRILDGYIAFFIAGQIAYAYVFWTHSPDVHDLIITGILFFGAIFVWVMSFLATQTVDDLRHVALLEQQSITDALTGLYNRRYLDERVSAEVAGARRYRLPLSVLMLDIDHFKRLNDTYGHQAGDLALQCFGRLVLDSIRKPDIAGRYGGEEFIIIAPNTRLADAGELAERIRIRLESDTLELPRAGQQDEILHLTISVGVAELAPDMESSDQLIACADRALYQAKQAGRNRSIQHRP